MTDDARASRCSVKTIFAIRDATRAGALSSAEALFLYVVESHGVAFGTATSLAHEMGLSRASYYRTREALIERGFLIAKERLKSTTVYQVHARALREQVSHTETPSQGDNGVSHTETGVSHRDNGGCLTGRTQRRDPEKRPDKGPPEAGGVASGSRTTDGTWDPLAALKARVVGG